MEIKVTPQTIKDFSYGRKFVRGLASRSIAPVILLEAFVEGGRTYQAYKRGGFTEARERITEEFVAALFWFSGVPLFSALIDKFVGKKVFKLPETDFTTGKDSLRNPVKNYIAKFQKELKKNPQDAEKMIAKYKFGKVMTSILLANALVGFVLPKVNQAITRHILKKDPEKANNNKKQENTSENKQTQQYSMEDFVNKNNKDKVSFGAINPQTLLSLAYNFENNPKYGLISTDMGVWVGRGVSARNKYERNEVWFRDISSTYFYMFNMPVIAMMLNKIQDGKSTRLDPIAAQQLTEHMNKVLQANGGPMDKEAFKEFMLGNPDKKAYLTPSISKELRNNNGIIELEKFNNLLSEVKSKYPEVDISKIQKAAKGMSELQPKIGGKAIISEKQILDVFKEGAINMPDFLKNVFTCATSDQNLFTGRVSKSNLTDELSFISKETFTKLQSEMERYVENVLKKAKDGKITEDLLKKVNRENLIKNSLNWGIGFAISAAFLSTFIPKMQYWITKKTTGSDEFPGTKSYSKNEKAS